MEIIPSKLLYYETTSCIRVVESIPICISPVFLLLSTLAQIVRVYMRLITVLGVTIISSREGGGAILLTNWPNDYGEE
jgi:hypothetical protein